MPNYVKVKEIEVEGKLFDVHVSDYRGEFVVVASGAQPSDQSAIVASEFVFDKLLPIVKRKSKEAATRVEVPFCMMHHGVLRMGVARGIHATKGVVLVTWSNGEKGELERYERDTYAIPPADVAAKANELAAATVVAREEEKRLEAELDTLLKPYQQKPDIYARGADRERKTIKELVQAAIAATIEGTVKAGVA